MGGSRRKYSVSLPEDLAEAVRARVGPGGFSAHVAETLGQNVTKEIADRVAVLLRAPHLHGHKYAIDAALDVIARNAPRPVTVLTSDP